MSSTPIRPLRRSDAEASRFRILEAARALFGEHGSDEVTMAQIAKRAGVSRATVFNHFGSKHALVEGVTEAVYAGYEAILERAHSHRDTPVPVLVRALFEIMGRGIEQDRPFYRTVFREIGRVNLGLDEGGVAAQAHQRVQLQAPLRQCYFGRAFIRHNPLLNRNPGPDKAIALVPALLRC